jgi:cytochrome c peroxidase
LCGAFLSPYGQPADVRRRVVTVARRPQGPILRGLAARAPYFHNGSAATLLDVVNFYDQRFGIGFTGQQRSDLINFLNAL